MDVIKTTVAAAVMVSGLTGCGFLNTTPTPQAAQIRLTSPATGTTIAPTDIVAIQGQYSGDAIVQVQLLVNGVADSALEVRAGDPMLAMDWLPKTTGRLILYLEGYDQSQAVVARSDAVVVMVDASATSAVVPTAAVTTTEAAPSEPTVAVTGTVAGTLTNTLTATVTSEITATAEVTSGVGSSPSGAAASPTTRAAANTASTSVLTVTTDSLNLRSGPGTDYETQGQLANGQTATVVGKNADGTWWQVRVDGTTAWVFGELVQASAGASGVPVVQAPPAPTAAPTAVPEVTPLAAATAGAEVAATTVPTAPIQIIEFVTAVPTETVAAPAAAPTAATAEPAATPVPAAQACGPSNPSWAAALNNNPQYEFCTPVPFEFVPGASADPDELVIRWHIFGIKSLELRIDPSGDSCGVGSTGRRQQVSFEEYNFRLNRRDFPPGGYKVGLWATLDNGRVQDWGELHFCGKG